MTTRDRVLFGILVSTCMLTTRAEPARALPEYSDRLIVTAEASTTPLYDETVPEAAAGVDVSPLIFGTALSFPEDLDRPGLAIVLLFHPFEFSSPEPHRPTGLLCCAVSYVVIALPGISGGLPTVMYWSDEDVQERDALITLLDTTPTPSHTGVLASGALQDITAQLGLEGSGYRVQVQSTVVPEPAVAIVVAAGLVGIGLHARGRDRNAGELPARATRPARGRGSASRRRIGP